MLRCQVTGKFPERLYTKERGPVQCLSFSVHVSNLVSLIITYYLSIKQVSARKEGREARLGPLQSPPLLLCALPSLSESPPSSPPSK